MASERKSTSGLGVDSQGGPVVDPTANVIALNDAANKRQDDLRELTDRLNALRIECQKEIGDLRSTHLKELSTIREAHQAQLRLAESARLDAIRQVDREDVNKTAVQVLSAVQTLAATNNTTAETLRTQVATTAQAAQTTFNSAMTEVNKRLSALELSSSEGKGKQTLADPMMAELVAEMKAAGRTLASGSGKTEGYERFIGWGIAVGAIVYAFVK